MSVRVLIGDVRERLAELPDESVHCVVTSPPYYGLRDYGTGTWEGGDVECIHALPAEWIDHNFNAKTGLGEAKTQTAAAIGRWYNKDGSCRCGATRIDRQIGLERTPDEFVATMVAVFREVRRVLRKDGTLWLNLGDSYVSAPPGNKQPPNDVDGVYKRRMERQLGHGEDASAIWKPKNSGLKPKDLMGMPWRVALALQADGWWLRQDIIWHKPNPMPESVRDRCTKTHEYIFLLSKSERYYYDADALREPHTDPGQYPTNGAKGMGSRRHEERQEAGKLGGGHSYSTAYLNPAGRNKRSVWTIATAPFPEAHFATFPPELPEICIKAGTSEKGCCAKCGAPWGRETEKIHRGGDRVNWTPETGRAKNSLGGQKEWDNYVVAKTIGWSPSCKCDALVVPATCLDPFGGAGTTGLVADRLGRNAILIELNPEYAAMAERRIRGDAGMFSEVGAA